MDRSNSLVKMLKNLLVKGKPVFLTVYYCSGCWSEENHPSFISSKIKLIFPKYARCMERITFENYVGENCKPFDLPDNM